jgi:uncharacterized membrane protein
MSEEKTAKEGIRVIAFVEEDAADEALKTLEKAKKEKTVQFWDAVVIRKDEKGHYYYNETKDMSTSKGAGIGALIGGILGIPGGPAGIVLGAGLGTGIGAFAANTDSGLKDETLEKFGRALQSGNSALFIVSSHEYLSAIQEYATEENATAVIQKLTADISEHMVHGQNAAYLVTAAGRSLSGHQLESDDEIVKLLGV